MISFEEFKKLADAYFDRITPEDMLKRFEALGYDFKDIREDAGLALSMEAREVPRSSFEVIPPEQELFRLNVDFSYTIIAA